MRLRVMELPGSAFSPSFILVIDRVGHDRQEVTESLKRHSPSISDRIGAKAVLVFADEVEIP